METGLVLKSGAMLDVLPQGALRKSGVPPAEALGTKFERNS